MNSGRTYILALLTYEKKIIYFVRVWESNFLNNSEQLFVYLVNYLEVIVVVLEIVNLFV